MTKFGEEAALWGDGLVWDASINGATEEPKKRYTGWITSHHLAAAIAGKDRKFFPGLFVLERYGWAS
jgi:hypothetical protein